MQHGKFERWCVCYKHMCVFEKTRERGKEGREGRKAYRIENHWRHKKGAKRERRGERNKPRLHGYFELVSKPIQFCPCKRGYRDRLEQKRPGWRPSVRRGFLVLCLSQPGAARLDRIATASDCRDSSWFAGPVTTSTFSATGGTPGDSARTW